LIEVLQDREPTVRQQAAWALSNIHPDPKIAVPALGKILKHDEVEVRLSAISVLRRLPAADTLPCFLEALQDRDARVRQDAILGLTPASGKADQIVPALASLVKDDNERVRHAVLPILSRFGAEAVPPLAEALQNKDPVMRWTAASSLGNLGPVAKKAIPNLAQAVRDPNATVRNYAVYALTTIGPESVPALAELLKDKEPNVRQLALSGLAKFGNKARDAAPLLIETLKDPIAANRAQAASVLGQLGPEARSAIPMLNETLKDPDAKVQREAELALKKIQGKGR
jgi:HEAT repeat protein